ncbi:uncharacterized protein LOC111716268 isoform X2 [Eurytemora carolleeae]|uniref:uncharacterized protein LOC111716268 isoform X2 n=1 Tax=Eurytemora carolleeae TaxID=1294199 RepID=UPI000C77C513|nr:uncharacterized protein LOC111716268 isoform X2 [Eurytemora carolleeae]|eukprot:XP_023347474.1 uncharacterized protein LOC111716268 isoform X2 [Eurytemora affinis]
MFGIKNTVLRSTVCMDNFSRNLSVLVLNAGSSSIKFQVLDTSTGEHRVKGLAQNLNKSKGELVWSRQGKQKTKSTLENTDLETVLEQVLKIVSTESIDLIGHRVVHGGEKYTLPTKLNKDVVKNLKYLSKLAPLHNPAQLAVIEHMLDIFGLVPQAAIFDTAFYSRVPPHAFMYPVPYSWYSQYGVRKYGFHGISHQYITEEAAVLLSRPLASLNIVSCHLGAGCSVTASKGGVGVDTSMGFSPLSGIMMGSRSGDVDPTVLLHIAGETGRTMSSILEELNSNSGFKGITGTPDSIEVEHMFHQNEEKGILAVDMFGYNIAKYIASFLVPLGRIDALVFSGGIGENSSLKRAVIIQHLSCLGFKCETEANNSLLSDSCKILNNEQ